jgi:sterol desaturase/sphingolipid hydroxylase (fatty acid hydroxylase superfamily)
MWAIHVVHHSSEHYNLSTALRQPVAEAFGTFVPFGSLCLFGIRPGLVETARGVNLLYQYWIHTETVGTLGPAEEVLNTPSHHRVHHGSNRQYLDRNHGSILILWDKLFGTFEPEGDRVVYGLTKNINTFQPGRIATHEHAQMLRDVASSTSWRERLSYIVRGPGWANAHRAERDAANGSAVTEPAPPVLEVPVSA